MRQSRPGRTRNQKISVDRSARPTVDRGALPPDLYVTIFPDSSEILPAAGRIVDIDLLDFTNRSVSLTCMALLRSHPSQGLSRADSKML
jgi:hypothetical protein